MKEILIKIIFLIKNRFIIFCLFIFFFVSIQYFTFGTWLPSTETKDQWFYAGLFMVVFSLLFIEPYYTSPKNVITNTIPLLLVFLAIYGDFQNHVFWWFAVIIFIALIIASIISMTLVDKNKSPEHVQNKIADEIKNVTVFLGRGRVLYSAVFIYFLLTYYSIQTPYTLTLFITWFIILCIDPKYIHNSFSKKEIIQDNNQIGEIFSVQSRKIFLVKLFDDRKGVARFDLVKFKYSMQSDDDFNITGVVFETYLLNQEKWAKVLQLGSPKKDSVLLERNIVYKIPKEDVVLLGEKLKIENFVGIILEGSNIGKIKFEYSKRKDDLQEGDLLELEVGDRVIFYQVLNGSTEKEVLEAKNETGFIKGEAIQLGEWLDENISFQKFGWVPPINTPIFKADTSKIKINEFKYPDYKLGVIPGTSLPSIINLDEAVRCHMALLGVTGSGKSFLCQELIKELSKDTKIICVDLTGEWIKNLDGLKFRKLITKDALSSLEAGIAKKESTKDKVEILKFKKDIQEKMSAFIKDFSEAEESISLFELPDLSNTSFILEFTQLFLESIFLYAKNNVGRKYCIVLEEAHTIVPETSFLGDLGDYGSNKGLVSKMGQIALQGRKYGVGLLVIAQRTANVSKTILTQCNTVICFQAFDETSFAFLGNYVGKDMVQVLPNLKRFHAVVAGKAIKSNLPMIIDLTRQIVKV